MAQQRFSKSDPEPAVSTSQIDTLPQLPVLISSEFNFVCISFLFPAPNTIKIIVHETDDGG
jgi:hypothetical protein